MKILRHLVVGFDFSTVSMSALKRASQIASEYNATLHVVHVMAPEIASPFVPAIRLDLHHEVEKTLKQELDQFVKTHTLDWASIRIHVCPGLVYDQIIRVAHSVSAELIVVGSHSRHFVGRVLLGSQALKLVRHSPVPVLVHHVDCQRPLKTILVPIDEDETSESAIVEAQFFAQKTGASVQLIHVLNLPTYDYLDTTHMVSEAKIECEKYLNKLSKQYNLKTQPVVLEGSVAREMRSYIEQHPEVSLVTLNTHGRKGVDRFLLGSVAEQIVQSVPVDVLCQRTEEHKKHLSTDFEKGLLF